MGRSLTALGAENFPGRGEKTLVLAPGGAKGANRSTGGLLWMRPSPLGGDQLGPVEACPRAGAPFDLHGNVLAVVGCRGCDVMLKTSSDV